ncbi:Pex12 amino terminal region-domain-containing protein [Fimicolochytrium jonesii]|uniref:Pex12 amino terminal region-domain-containing protein n=1 Tax=Fimicolochytrium jonesii TaxID=1396493 RepID=UPI0022FDB47C|nr:Pex12 amino terminal region-domain-containing protein [Fimicolochytrium jonesii]KAI8822974.1 Pex12 amino terminal region-domain-containing protein [Fimicolochytrium jonesii]
MEYLSNISNAGANDVYRPSLFELVAQDKMRDLLKPALQYILAVYAQRYPRYLLRMANRTDELFALLMAVVERWYLRERDASFAEHFYGLRRISANFKQRANKNVPRLDAAQCWRSLFMLVGLPYIKTRLDEAYEKVSGGAGSRIFGDVFAEDGFEAVARDEPWKARWEKRIKRAFRTGYPFANAGYQMLIFVYQIGYMYGKTDYYSPWLHLCGLQVRRLSMKDYRDQEERDRLAREQTNAMLSRSSKVSMMRHMLAMFLTRGLDLLKYALPMSIFFFKFLEWWYSSEYHKQVGKKPIPPPPEKVEPNPKGLPLPDDPTICPICSQPRTNPTMVPSGYVYCYPCIFRWIEEKQECPVTLMPTNIEQLRKIYST